MFCCVALLLLFITHLNLAILEKNDLANKHLHMIIIFFFQVQILLWLSYLSTLLCVCVWNEIQAIQLSLIFSFLDDLMMMMMNFFMMKVTSYHPPCWRWWWLPPLYLLSSVVVIFFIVICGLFYLFFIIIITKLFFSWFYRFCGRYCYGKIHKIIMKRKEKNRHGSSSYNDDDPCCIIWFCNSGLRHYYYRLYRWYRFCSGFLFGFVREQKNRITFPYYTCWIFIFSFFFFLNTGNSTSNKREIINDDIYGCHLVTFQHSLIHSINLYPKWLIKKQNGENLDLFWTDMFIITIFNLLLHNIYKHTRMFVLFFFLNINSRIFF